MHQNMVPSNWVWRIQIADLHQTFDGRGYISGNFIPLTGIRLTISLAVHRGLPSIFTEKGDHRIIYI